ncbi:hypothetical protein, partial [Gluconacetobacter entanii]
HPQSTPKKWNHTEQLRAKGFFEPSTCMYRHHMDRIAADDGPPSTGGDVAIAVEAGKPRFPVEGCKHVFRLPPGQFMCISN